MIVDASVTIAWSVEVQQTPAVLAVLAAVARDGAMAPQLWPIEVAHVLTKLERRKAIPKGDDRQRLANLSKLGIRIDDQTADLAWTATFELAAKHKLTVYDATYLELAIRLQLPLATLDDELIAAARAEGLTVLP